MLDALQPLDQALSQIGRRLEVLEAPQLPAPDPRKPRY